MYFLKDFGGSTTINGDSGTVVTRRVTVKLLEEGGEPTLVLTRQTKTREATNAIDEKWQTEAQFMIRPDELEMLKEPLLKALIEIE